MIRVTKPPPCTNLLVAVFYNRLQQPRLSVRHRTFAHKRKHLYRHPHRLLLPCRHAPSN